MNDLTRLILTLQLKYGVPYPQISLYDLNSLDRVAVIKELKKLKEFKNLTTVHIVPLPIYRFKGIATAVLDYTVDLYESKMITYKISENSILEEPIKEINYGDEICIYSVSLYNDKLTISFNTVKK